MHFAKRYEGLSASKKKRLPKVKPLASRTRESVHFSCFNRLVVVVTAASWKLMQPSLYYPRFLFEEGL